MMELAESAGELTLQSTDPDVQPHIDCRYLEADWDRERMREAVRIVLNVCWTMSSLATSTTG